MFGFQRLDVYRCATEFLACSASLCELVPKGQGSLSDQLKRAALSIPLNIAEGSGRMGGNRRQLYAVARGSALECAAILDAIEILTTRADESFAKPRELLDRIVAMLTVMLRE